MKKILLLVAIVAVIFTGCPESPELVAINVTPNKVVYKVGESVAPNDIEVVATYGDGTTKAVSNYTIIPVVFSAVGKVSVQVVYSENEIAKTAIYEVTVNDPVPPTPPTPNSDFVKINAGEFLLNSDLSYRVILTKAFEICKHEVTQKEYKEIMGKNLSHFKGTSNPPAEGEDQNLRPVERVTWYEAIAYCNMRTEKEGIKIGSSQNIDYVYFSDSEFTTPYTADDASIEKPVYIKVDNQKKIASLGYRLPTDAEWEIAARGGLAGDVYAGTDDRNNLRTYAWYNGNKTHQVMTREPNSYGLYDMNGNVWEWCWDYYEDSHPDSVVDPLGPASASYRVIRGGDYGAPASFCKVAFRRSHLPAECEKYIGFRVVRFVY